MPDPVRPQFAITLVDAETMRAQLAEVTDVDASALIAKLAGQEMEIFPLMLEVTFFCGENGLETFEFEGVGVLPGEFVIASSLIHEDNAERLVDLMGHLDGQLASG